MVAKNKQVNEKITLFYDEKAFSEALPSRSCKLQLVAAPTAKPFIKKTKISVAEKQTLLGFAQA